MVNEFSTQEIKECFMEFTMKLSRLGLDRFSLSIKSRNVNLFVETSEKRDKTHSRKRKSPSNLKRSHLRKQLFLRRKREQLASSLPVPQPEDVISSPGVISRPTLTPNSSNIMPCDSCDQSFLNSRNLSIHQAKMHDGKICQLDGQTDMDDLESGDRFRQTLMKNIDNLWDRFMQALNKDMEKYGLKTNLVINQGEM